jgi:ATP-dependent Lon protease
MPGKGQLILTGSLGDVMKESAQAALSYLRSQAKNLGIDLADYGSAGVTIVVAIASLLMRRRVRSDMAMTGEISLRGRVLRVGGIKEKVLAAARFGVKHVILPDQNRTDWEEVPAEVRKKMTVHFVKHISDLIPLALRAK